MNKLYLGDNLTTLKSLDKDSDPPKHCNQCDQPILAKGLCSKHYERNRRKIDCKITGCNTKAKYQKSQLCDKHYARIERHGDANYIWNRPKGTINKDGYRRYRNKNGVFTMEHRLVMEAHLGRELEKHENVHHLNGNRADNRLENLELWSTKQPYGQRVEDKVAYAKEILNLYEPEALK